MMNDAENSSPEWFLADVKKASFKETDYDNGVQNIKMLRMTLQEGKRITLFDIHAQAAKEMGEYMIKWAQENGAGEG